MNLLTENQARKLWCPDRKDRIHVDQNCVHTECMAWEKSNITIHGPAGHCSKYQGEKSK